MSSQRYDTDIAVIGGGVTGCAIARELSRYDLNVCVLERTEDVCSGTSKANSAIIHTGYDAQAGSVMARMNVEGNRLMDRLAADLDIPFRRNGSLVLCFSEEDMPGLQALYVRGVTNGVPELRIISGDEARAMEPNLTDEVVAALYAPTGGIVCPFQMTIALAENAYENGAEFRFLTEVTEIRRYEEGYELTIRKRGERLNELNSDASGAVSVGPVPDALRCGGRDAAGTGAAAEEMQTITARFVVNAAGVYADRFHNMVSRHTISITPSRGSYCLLDQEAGRHVDRTIFQLPGKYGKGVLVTPTIHGNLLIGPTAADTGDREGTCTTAEELAEVTAKSARGVKDIPYRQVITSFAGLRAHEAGHEFILGEPEDAPGFFDAAGIESPGLSSAPAIGVYLAEMIARKAGARQKEHFVATRKGIVHVAAMDREARAALIAERPDYGTIVCRCENVSEGEIVDSIRRPLGARSLDGIKRRVRQGMGRSQAGFCTPRTMEILSRETGIPMEKICKNQPGSEMITGGA